MGMNEPQEGALNAAVALELSTLRFRQHQLTGLTVDEFARRSGIGVRTMPRYLNGERQISVSKLEDMCRVLGVDPAEVVARAVAHMQAGATAPGASSETG